MKRQKPCSALRAARAAAQTAALLSLTLLFAAAIDTRAADLKDTTLNTPGITSFNITHEAPDLAADSDPAKEKREDKTKDKTDAEAEPEVEPKAAQDNDEFKRWGFSAHAGVAIPHPDFSDSFQPGLSVGVDLEYRFNKYFSLEAIYNFHRFGGETVGPFGPGNVFFELDSTDIHQLSLNGRVYAAGGNSPFRPFFNFGGGAYVFESTTVRGGINLGGGLQFDVTEKFAVEGGYNFHNVFVSGDSLRFSTVQGGVRFRF